MKIEAWLKVMKYLSEARDLIKLAEKEGFSSDELSSHIVTIAQMIQKEEHKRLQEIQQS